MRRVLPILVAAVLLIVALLVLDRAPTPGPTQEAVANTPDLPPTPTALAPIPILRIMPILSPYQVPADLPRPRALPSNLPRTDIVIIGDGPPETVAGDVSESALVVRARITAIQPPRWRTPTGMQPLYPLDEGSVMTPATFEVLHIYKGPNMTSFEAGIGGACWSDTLCTHFSVEYHWQDLIGYDILMFANRSSPEDPWFQGYYPWKIYIVDPSNPDNLLIPERDGPQYDRFSRLDPAIRAVPGVNPSA